jgi:hypothetical protein
VNQLAWVLHSVWLGGEMPLRSWSNLWRLSAGFDYLEAATDASSNPPYMPLLWLDASAWRHVTQSSWVPVREIGLVPAHWQAACEGRLGIHAGQCRWVSMDFLGRTHCVPVMIYEEMKSVLTLRAQDTVLAAGHLNALAQTSAGLAFLTQELSLDPAAPAWGCDVDDAASFYALLVDHVRQHWAGHGLLCLASDVVRLQVLSRWPGGYVDLGDVAGLLPNLPSAMTSPNAEHVFCGHHTIAIENDVMFCRDAGFVHALLLGMYGAIRQTFIGMASKLGVSTAELNLTQIAQAVLPHLDARMPRKLDVAKMFDAPYTVLLEYINMAYGAASQFGHENLVGPYLSARTVKGHLIDHVGGFVAYQKLAHQLAPDNAKNWGRYAQSLGLEHYAPQLGWKVQGFGVLDRFIHDGRLVRDGSPLSDWAGIELQRLAQSLGLNPDQAKILAVFAADAYDQMKEAYFAPEQSAASVTRLISQAQALSGC